MADGHRGVWVGGELAFVTDRPALSIGEKCIWREGMTYYIEKGIVGGSVTASLHLADVPDAVIDSTDGLKFALEVLVDAQEVIALAGEG